MASTTKNTQEGVKSKKKGKWGKFKLKEIIGNPAFIGKTVRLGDSIFEVKGVLAGEDKKMLEKGARD
jgi:hypothetical protein